MLAGSYFSILTSEGARMKIGFDNELYVRKQMEHILERMKKFENNNK